MKGRPPEPLRMPHASQLPEQGGAGDGGLVRNFEDQVSTAIREATHRNWANSTPGRKALGAGNHRLKPVNSVRWKPTKFIPMKPFKLAFPFNGFIKQTLRTGPPSLPAIFQKRSVDPWFFIQQLLCCPLAFVLPTGLVSILRDGWGRELLSMRRLVQPVRGGSPFPWQWVYSSPSGGQPARATVFKESAPLIFIL